MMRRALRYIVFALLLAGLMAPVLESFDRWDTKPGIAGDTEFEVCGLVIVVGLAGVVALAVTRWRPRLKLQLRLSLPVTGRALRGAERLPFFPGSSPPDVPLRI